MLIDIAVVLTEIAQLATAQGGFAGSSKRGPYLEMLAQDDLSGSQVDVAWDPGTEARAAVQIGALFRQVKP